VESRYWKSGHRLGLVSSLELDWCKHAKSRGSPGLAEDLGGGSKRDCDFLGNCDPWTNGSGWAGNWLYRIFKAVTV
jgi:hypothetical protein